MNTEDLFDITEKHAVALAKELCEHFGFGQLGNVAFERAVGILVAMALTKPGNDGANSINQELAASDLAWRLQQSIRTFSQYSAPLPGT